MRLKNYTDVPDEKIKEYIEFYEPFDLSSKMKVVIHNAQRKDSHGHSYNGKKEISVSIVDEKNKHNLYPQLRDFSALQKIIELNYEKYDRDKKVWKTENEWRAVPSGKRNGYLPILLLSREEDFIHIIAHELGHQWQHGRPLKSLYVWGARDKSTNRSKETDADAYAIKKVREWRRTHKTDALRISALFWNRMKFVYGKKWASHPSN